VASGGRLAVIGMQGGVNGELNLGLLMMKRASVYAASLRARPLAEKAAIVSAVREHVWPLVSSGQIVPVIDQILPLDEAAQAHRRMESSDHVGKVLLAT
jgi:NADPH:quinone reductase-like Zn-dependent oxidoreductase